LLTFKRGYPALEEINNNPPDLVLLDIELPDINGMKICRILKEDTSIEAIPIIMLTGNISERDKIKGLNMGADDYVTKPFSKAELLARINAVLRRIKYNGSVKDTLSVADICVDVNRREVRVGKRILKLSNTEFNLLCLLMKKAGEALTKDEILFEVWGYTNNAVTRTVDSYIYRLRQKLGKRASKRIKTVRDMGYKFVDDSSSESD